MKNDFTVIRASCGEIIRTGIIFANEGTFITVHTKKEQL
jgi:hypothetical protein